MKKFAISLLASAAVLGFVSATYAADLVVEEPPVAVMPASIWEGGYIGVFGGFGWANVDHDPLPIIKDDHHPPYEDDDPPHLMALEDDGDYEDDDDFDGLCFPDGCNFDMTGWLLGVNAGYNFALNGGGSAVIGIAGDIAWVDLSGDHFFDEDFGDMHSNVSFEGSLRGVLGWDGGVWMPYVTAGVSFLSVNHRWDEFDFEADNTHFGGTAGVGVAYAVAENLFLDLQWRASWYDKDEFDFGFDDEFDFDGNPNIGLVTNRVTAGLNWSF